MPSTNIYKIDKISKREIRKVAGTQAIRTGTEILDYLTEVERLLTIKAVNQCRKLIEEELRQYFQQVSAHILTLTQQCFQPASLLMHKENLISFLESVHVNSELLTKQIEGIIRKRFGTDSTVQLEFSKIHLGFEPLRQKIQSLTRTYRLAWVVGQVIDNLAGAAIGSSSQTEQFVYDFISPHSILLKVLEIDDVSIGKQCRQELHAGLQGAIESLRLQAASELSHACTTIIYDLHDHYIESRLQVSTTELWAEEA